jgi:membrane-bound lytic murein transglycosylase F
MRRLAAGILLLAIAAAAPLSGVDTDPPVPRFIDATELVVVTRNSPTTRYIDPDGNFAGVEHDLVEMFARELRIPVRFVEASSYADVLPRLERGQAHMAAAGLAITPERARRFLFSPPYMEVQQVLVHNDTLPRPRTLRDLQTRRIEVVADSSAAETLHNLAERMPGLRFEEVRTVNPEDLLIRVAEGKTDYAVTGSHIVDVARNFHPNLAKSLVLGDGERIAWAFAQDGDDGLVAKARAFLKRVASDGTLKRLMDRYYGHVTRLDRADLDGLFEAMRARLPAYRALFKQAQELTGIDWRLLAALGFQESKWDPLATSPTGVRGMMMLTGTTADRLGVRDRLDARASIFAGARYLRDLRDALPPRIGEPDRTWMALAAYNQGLGHLEDARQLAQRQGLNPDAWVDLKRSLPLLSRPDVYETLRHGFARGGEALALTENVRTFYDILVRFEAPHRPGDDPAGLDSLNAAANEAFSATLGRLMAGI